jgi:hypothetical protein
MFARGPSPATTSGLLGTEGVHTVGEALAIQQWSCADLGSPLYADLLAGLAADHAAGGLTAELLEGRTDRPVHDALPLRLLGAVHRIVLAGRAPRLAAHYPSAGGTPAGDPTGDFLDVAAANRDEVIAGLARQVQTNEVGRAAALAPGFVEITRRFGQPLHLLEVGSSAGLLLRWDGYRYEAGGHLAGDPDSELRFTDAWEGTPPDLAPGARVARRRGCDVSPIDATTPDGRLTLLSFVWPDQRARFERLDAALRIAAGWPVEIDTEDAGSWVERQLTEVVEGSTTVVFHSIVLQYLPPASRRRMVAALEQRGRDATHAAPLAWLRLEPAGRHADLRLTTWPGGRAEILAEVGYHGVPVRWSTAPQRVEA